MDNIIVLSAIAVVVGVGFAILYNKLVIKDYPETSRKGKCAATIIVFLLVSLAIFESVHFKAVAIKTIQEQSNNLEQLIKDSYPNSDLVKNGYDLKNAPQVNNIVGDIRLIIPSHADLGMNKAIYDIVMDYAMNELHKKLAVIDFAVQKANSFTDENGFLTVSSVIGSLRDTVINVVKIVFIVVVSIFSLVFVIYVVTSLVTAKKERERAKASAETSAA